MKQFRNINLITGWIVWAIASFVYVSTIEPTASWWDCGEYIAAAYKLMVGHEPGAPTFQLIARLFSLLAGDDVTQVAKWVNTMSALASSFTILFLFWSVVHFGRKMFLKSDDDYTPARMIAVLGSGAVGALAYTFTDSFWFSAVEGEVYAMSSFFTALVFWTMLRWETVADKRHAERWIILIAFFVGLSIGVHLLNLLAIPALTFIYYFKKYEPTKKGVVITGLVSIVILVIVQYGIIPGVVYLASRFELLFVNGFGMPFNSGVVVYFVLLAAALVYGLYYTHKNNLPLHNTVLLCITFLLIGYSSYFQTVIRSNANTPMDESNPENVFALHSYLNREQYGDRPLFYGHYFNAAMEGKEDGAKIYHQGEEKYEVVGQKAVPVYEKENSGLFPRMYSSQGHHIREYVNWTGCEKDEKPTFGQNLEYLFKYQLGHMYMRYFLWNFGGRQNDIQGHGSVVEGKPELLSGNWLSGIPFIDEARLGPQDNLPPAMTGNKAYNKFYLLPFILGLIGLFFHYKKHKLDFTIVMLLFFFTGVAIVIYLNQYPYQPRERDYAYAGSFFAYSIWIGIGALGVFDFLSKKLPQVVSAGLAVLLGLFAGPYILAKDGWDDHDRSNRYAARDLASNYLNSCEPNAILFTNGDNDTFPLWYAQEVEGIRTDVRVVNLSLLNTNWYIDQLRRKAYDSDPLPFSIPEEKLLGDRRLQVPVYDRGIKGYVDIDKVVDFVANDDAKYKLKTRVGEYNYLPTSKISLAVDSAFVVDNGVVPEAMADRIVPAINWEIQESTITRNKLMVLDILAHNDWKRPVYFAVTVGSDHYMNLEDYFMLEGLAYRIVPIKKKGKGGQTGVVNTEKMYEKMVKEFKWGNMQDPDVYHGTETERMTLNFRNLFARLAQQLLNEGKKEQAIETLDRCMEIMPQESIELNFAVLPIIETYLKAGEKEKGVALAQDVYDVYKQEMEYFISLEREYAARVDREPRITYSVLQKLLQMSKTYKLEDFKKQLEAELPGLMQGFMNSPVGQMSRG